MLNNRVFVWMSILATGLAVIYFNISAQEQGQRLRAEKDLAVSQQRELRLGNMLQQAKNDLQVKSQENQQLEQELRVAIFRGQTFKTQIADLQQNLSRVGKEMAEVRLVNEMMSDKIKQMLTKKPVKLERIVIESGIALPSGRIVSINKDFDFVIIDLGENDGLRSGAVLTVYKGNRNLGEVQIEKIYDSISAATILPNTQKDEIENGDTVRSM